MLPHKQIVWDRPEMLEVQRPQWLQEYAAWHAATKGTPNATYLVQFCADQAVCTGIGVCKCTDGRGCQRR